MEGIEDKYITNSEVMTILNKKIKKDIDLTPFEYFVYLYHEHQSGEPFFHKQRLLKLAEYLQQFELTSQEKIVIANYPPTSIVEFYSIFPHPSSYSDDEIMKIIQEMNEIMQMEISEEEKEQTEMKPKKHYKKKYQPQE